MKRRTVILSIAAAGLMVLGVGCIREVLVDPNTGEESRSWRLDPDKADQGEAIADAAVGAGGLASMLIPWLAPFVTAGVGGLAAWRKLRPKLEEATRERDISVKAGSTLAEALEMIKEKHPQIWKDISPIIAEASKSTSEMENVIRGFRGLEPRPTS